MDGADGRAPDLGGMAMTGLPLEGTGCAGGAGLEGADGRAPDFGGMAMTGLPLAGMGCAGMGLGLPAAVRC